MRVTGFSCFEVGLLDLKFAILEVTKSGEVPDGMRGKPKRNLKSGKDAKKSRASKAYGLRKDGRKWKRDHRRDWKSY